MATAVLCRRGAQLCCIHRELYRVVWRPQTLRFSSKPTDRKQLRRTHIKKAKAQPPVDINSLVEKLFSLTRADIVQPNARLSRGVQKPPASSSSSSSTVPPAVDSVQPNAEPPANLETLESQIPPDVTADSLSAVTTANSGTSAGETLSKADSASESSSFPAASVTQSPVETQLESSLSPGNAFETSASVVEGPADVSVDNAPTNGAESEVVHFSYPDKELSTEAIDPPVESPVKSSVPPEEPLPNIVPVFEGPVESGEAVESLKAESSNSDSADILHSRAEELPVKSQLESPTESSIPLVEPLQVPLESIVDVTLDNTPQEQAESTDTVVNASHAAGGKYLTQTTIESPVESTVPLVEPLQAEALTGPVECRIDVTIDSAHQEVLTTDLINTVAHDAGIESATETTIESGVETNLSTETLTAKGAEELSVEDPTISTHTAQAEHLTENSDGLFHVTVESITEEQEAEKVLLTDSSETALKPLSFPFGNETEAASEGFATEKDSEKDPEKMTLESMTLHSVTVSVESLKTDELLRTKSELDERAASVQASECDGAAESQTEAVDDGESLTEVLSKWESLSEDLEGLEGESGMLVNELLCSVPTAVPQTPAKLNTSADPPEAAQIDPNTENGVDAMTLESITLAEVQEKVESLETEIFQETRESLEKKSEELVNQEKMQVEKAEEDVEVLEDKAEAELLAMDSIEEVTDALEAETSIMIEAMFGSEQGPRQPRDTTLEELPPQDDREGREVEGESDVLEAMSLESVTLAEVEASLGTLNSRFMSETADFLEKEAQLLVGETETHLEDEVVIEERTEGENTEPLSLPEAEDLETDALMEELLFTVPGHTVGAKEALIGQEGSTETHTDLDPVQRLFLQKIREYDQMCRLNDEPLQDDPELHKRLSEETAKLQRLFGGGDLTSFPQFNFHEPKMDQD